MVVVIDPQIAGVSGDMLLCSLVDLGADKDKVIQGVKRSAQFLPESTISHIALERIQKHGISSLQLALGLVEDSVSQRSGTAIKEAIAHSVLELGLSQKAQIFADSCIDTLISSESKIHGVARESVHLHEASSIDTLIDIVGVTIALEDLDLFDERILCLPVSVGSGSVTFSHGTMSNPASAILEIFKNSDLIIQGSDADQELTTPTGACILVNLVNESARYCPLMQVDSVGYGAGQNDFDSFANVLKVIRGSVVGADNNNKYEKEDNHNTSNNNHNCDDALKTDSVKILETNLDDVSGEILGNLVEKVMSRGALDISIYHGITKKGRPTNLVSVICTGDTIDGIVDTLISETGTLGIRVSDSTRFIVSRSSHNASLTLNDQTFHVNYKRSFFKGNVSLKIEFDDLKRISDILGKSIRETESLLRREIEKLESSNDCP